MTGGQYSLLRVLVGSQFMSFWGSRLALALSSNARLPATGASVFEGIPPVALAGLGFCASGFFILGLWDRAAAALLGLAMLGVAPIAGSDAALVMGFLLLHLTLSSKPPLSLAAKGRLDPRGDPVPWSFRKTAYGAAWLCFGLAVAARGMVTLICVAPTPTCADLERFEPLLREIPHTWGTLGLLAAGIVQIGFLPISCWSRGRAPVFWAMLVVLLARAWIVQGPWPWVLVLTFLVFAPLRRWQPNTSRGPTHTFYDGGCGLCHGVVRFLLAEDVSARLRFGPLSGETFRQWTSSEQRQRFGDSIVVVTARGETLTRSRAVIHLLWRLGGFWRGVAIFGGIIPRCARDALYELIARTRHRLFAAPAEACPAIPPELKERFLP